MDAGHGVVAAAAVKNQGASKSQSACRSECPSTSQVVAELEKLAGASESLGWYLKQDAEVYTHGVQLHRAQVEALRLHGDGRLHGGSQVPF